MMTETQIDETNPRRTVAAIFDDPAQAQQAIHDLKTAGFTDSEIGVAARDRDAQGALRHETGAEAAKEIGEDAVSGGLLGGAIGLLVGVGALAIPGVGPVIAGGIFSSIFGATAVGAGLGVVGGGVIGVLLHLGLPEQEAQYFATGFHSGGTLVTVHVAGRADEARSLLAQNGGDTGGSEQNSV